MTSWNILSIDIFFKFNQIIFRFCRKTRKFKMSETIQFLNTVFSMSPYSSVVEHWSCKPGVESSNLSGGSFFAAQNYIFWWFGITFILICNVKILKFRHILTIFNLFFEIGVFHFATGERTLLLPRWKWKRWKRWNVSWSLSLRWTRNKEMSRVLFTFELPLEMREEEKRDDVFVHEYNEDKLYTDRH